MYAFSRPEGWKFYKEEMMSHSTDGRTSFEAGIKELGKFGYLHRTQPRNDGGRFVGLEWHFFEIPISEEEFKKSFQNTGFTALDNPAFGKPTPNKKEDSNIDLSKKKNYPPPPSRSRKSTRPPKSSASPPPLVVPLSLEKLEAVSERVKKRIAKNHSVSDIDQAVEAVLAYSQENEVDNWDSLLSKAVKEKWKPKAVDSEEERRAKLEKIRATYNASIDPIEVGGYIVEVWGDEVLFRYPSNDSSKSVSFNVNDKNFIRKVNEFYNKHRRMDNRATGTAKDSEETKVLSDLKRRDSSL